jgi:hypothetical protein
LLIALDKGSCLRRLEGLRGITIPNHEIVSFSSQQGRLQAVLN